MTALNFPSSPTNGQTSSAAGVTWTYSNTYATWNITSSGPTGYVGSQGYSGSQGIIGYTGSKGTDGVIGYNGSNGYNGSQGYTGSGATGVNWINKSTTYTAVNNDGIIANTSGASFTVKLPASPTTGYYVVFIDGNSSFATNPLTVDGNGGTIATSYTTTTLNITNSKVEFIYNGSTWEIATSTGTRGYSGSVGYTGSLGYTGSQGYTGSASTVIGYTGSKGDIGYTGSIPAALTATSLALGGATLGTNNLAVTGTMSLSGLLTAAGGVSSTLTTDATSATTGSIITAGGISTQKALWVGTTSRLVGNVQADALVSIGTTPQTGVPLYIQAPGAYVQLNSTTNGYSAIFGQDSGTQRWAIGQLGGNYGNGISFFYGTTEGMRLDSSGNLLVNCTSTGVAVDGARLMASNLIQISRTNADALSVNLNGSNGACATFYKAGVSVGSISVTGSATAYNTSSDQRLKTNIIDASEATADLLAVKVRSFDWKSDDSHQRYGMVAQELLELVLIIHFYRPNQDQYLHSLLYQF